jgi:Holliday junction resolvasome RuvABC ATP-dependent DNA helicase subunit
LRWVRDYSVARADGQISHSVARDALDRPLLSTTTAATRSADRLSRSADRRRSPRATMDVASTRSRTSRALSAPPEFVIRSPRGRQVTSAAYLHLGLPSRPRPDFSLFDPRAGCSDIGRAGE